MSLIINFLMTNYVHLYTGSLAEDDQGDEGLTVGQVGSGSTDVLGVVQVVMEHSQKFRNVNVSLKGNHLGFINGQGMSE